MFVSILMTIIGYGFISALLNEESVWEKLALGFLLGFGLITLPLFFLIYFHVRLNIQTIWEVITPLLAVSLLLTLIFRRRKSTQRLKRFSFKKLTGLQKILLVLILLLLAASFIINFYWPVNTWDSIALYDIRAKIFASGGLLPDLWPQLNKNIAALGYYYSYPPGTSLAHAVGYLLRDPSIMIIYSFFYASLILLFMTMLIKKTSLTTGLFITLLLASNGTIFYHSTIAYTNLPYATYLMALFFMLERYVSTRQYRYFLLALCFSILSISIRILEPFYLLIAVFLLINVRNNYRYIWDFIILTGTSYLFKRIEDSYFVKDLYLVSRQTSFQSAFPIPKIISAALNPGRLYEVLTYLYYALTNYHLYILFFIFCSLFFLKTLKKNLATALVIIFSILILIPGAIALSSYYIDWNKIPDSVNRAMIFLYPLILYFIVSFPEVEKVLNRVLYFYPKRISKKLRES